MFLSRVDDIKNGFGILPGAESVDEDFEALRDSLQKLPEKRTHFHRQGCLVPNQKVDFWMGLLVKLGQLFLRHTHGVDDGVVQIEDQEQLLLVQNILNFVIHYLPFGSDSWYAIEDLLSVSFLRDVLEAVCALALVHYFMRTTLYFGQKDFPVFIWTKIGGEESNSSSLGSNQLLVEGGLVEREESNHLISLHLMALLKLWGRFEVEFCGILR